MWSSLQSEIHLKFPLKFPVKAGQDYAAGRLWEFLSVWRTLARALDRRQQKRGNGYRCCWMLIREIVLRTKSVGLRFSIPCIVSLITRKFTVRLRGGICLFTGNKARSTHFCPSQIQHTQQSPLPSSRPATAVVDSGSTVPLLQYKLNKPQSPAILRDGRFRRQF
jgi:hypothetical protein